MAIVWGGWAMRDAYYGQRVGINVARSGSTFTVTYYVQTTGSVYYNGLTLNRTGAISSDVGFNWNTGGAEWHEVNQATYTGSPGGSYSFGAQVSLPWWGGSMSVSTSASVPISKPSAPTSPTATRVSDNRIDLTWNYSSTSSAPVVADAVDRSDVTSGYESWARVASLNPAKKAWSDTSVQMGRRYSYRVRTGNSAGDSAWTYFADVSTTPLPPTNVAAVKNADGSITVSWTPPSADYGTNFLVSDGATQVGTVGRDTTSWTDPTPSTSVTHTYTVRTYEASGDLTSAASAPSNTVQLLAAPNAPTGLAPNGASRAIEDGSFTLSWVHNPVDASAQTSAEYRTRVQGSGTWVTGAVATAQSVSVSPASFTPGVVYEWQARTRGAYQPSAEAGFSPWSATATFSLVNAPGVSISSPDPDSTLNVSQLTTAWTYFQAQGHGQASAEVQLVQDPDEDTPILRESRTVTGTATTVALQTALGDQQRFMVRVRARSGDGLWSAWDEARFTVVYAKPLRPDVTAVWDPDMGAAQVSVFNPDPGTLQVLQVLIDAATGRPYAQGA